MCFCPPHATPESQMSLCMTRDFQWMDAQSRVRDPRTQRFKQQLLSGNASSANVASASFLVCILAFAGTLRSASQSNERGDIKRSRIVLTRAGLGRSNLPRSALWVAIFTWSRAKSCLWSVGRNKVLFRADPAKVFRSADAACNNSANLCDESHHCSPNNTLDTTKQNTKGLAERSGSCFTQLSRM